LAAAGHPDVTSDTRRRSYTACYTVSGETLPHRVPSSASKAKRPCSAIWRSTCTRSRRGWLATGVAGIIGSNLRQALLDMGQWVVGLDNYATGKL
jgi:hypothetical protein